jgi:hypothetical protein
LICHASRGFTLFVLFLTLLLALACSTPPSPNTNSTNKNTSAPASLGPPLYEGFHDISNCDGLVGWAWDQNNPDSPIKVDIYDGDNLIATVTADEFRQDLVNARKGNGNHGFSYAIPPTLKDGKVHSIRIKYAGTSMDLGNTLKTINCKFQQ